MLCLCDGILVFDVVRLLWLSVTNRFEIVKFSLVKWFCSLNYPVSIVPVFVKNRQYCFLGLIMLLNILMIPFSVAFDFMATLRQ